MSSETFLEKRLRLLAQILEEKHLSEIEVSFWGLRLRIARHNPSGAVTIAAPAAVPAPAAPPAPAPAASAPAPAAAPADSEHPGMVPSPMVGVVYLSPEPGAKPFVAAGDQIQEGQTLLIVEAMKTMNMIPSPRSGTLLRLLVENGQAVEYGEPLLIIE